MFLIYLKNIFCLYNMYKFERIESIQFKTELKLKLENPFCVDKKIIRFDYNPKS